MPATITRIIGIGGNPPTYIRIEGTVIGCESLDVMTSCTLNTIRIPIPTGGSNQWSIDVPNNNNCNCGSSVKVTVFCNLGSPSQTDATTTLPLDCDICPTGTISYTEGPCINGIRTVTLEATVTAPPNSPAAGQWDFGYAPPGGSSVGPQFGIPQNQTQSPLQNPTLQQSWDFPPGNYLACLKWNPALHSRCPDTCVNFTVNACPDCCPILTLSQPTITGCAPASAVASFAAVLTWPQDCTPVQPVLYVWTLNGPSGKYTKRTNLPSTDTSTQWEDASGNPAMVQFPFTNISNYSISVIASFSGIKPTCFPTDTLPFSISLCCPQLIGPLNATADPSDPCLWLFSAQVSNPNNAPVTFDWQFHDNPALVVGLSVPQTTHRYAANSNATGQTTLTMKSSGCPDQTLSVTVTHSCQDSTPPTITGCSVIAGSPGTITVTFSEDVDQVAATNPGNFAVTVNGTPRVPTSLSYSPNTTTISGITVNPGDNVSITITNVADKAGNVIVGNNTTSCSAPIDGGNGGGGSLSLGCWILLIAAIVLGVIACILGIIAACTLNPYLGIAAGITGFVALVLLILWLIFCAGGSCALFNWARWIVIWILMIAPIVAILVGTFGNPMCGLIALGILWGYWGLVLAILDISGPKIGCPLTPPPWP